MKQSKELVIIGGGISGLSAAFYAQKQNIDFILLEASPRFGGAISTVIDNGFIFEQGPTSLVISECLREITQTVGIQSLAAEKKAKHKLVLSEYKLHQITKPFYLFYSDFLSLNTKIALIRELFASTQKLSENNDEETVAAFFCRKFNDEFLSKLIAPILSGIYAGDPSKLSLDAVWPSVSKIDKKHGSLIRGFLLEVLLNKNRSTSSREIYSFTNGLEALIKSLVDFLPSERIKLNSSVERIEVISEKQDNYSIQLGNEVVYAKNIVIATPSYVAAKLLPEYLVELGKVEYSPIVTISCWAERFVMSDDFKKKIEGSFGFLSAKDLSLDSTKILGVIFNSSLFPNRAPGNKYSFTCFVGGASFTEAVTMSDEELNSLCLHELEKIFNTKANNFEIKLLSRWQKAVPQMCIGHRKLMSKVLKSLPCGFAIAGNYIDGVSIEQAAMSGKKAIEKLANQHH